MDRICQEVFKHKQFSWTNGINVANIRVKEREAYRVALRIAYLSVLMRSVGLRDFTFGATYFHRDDVKPYWSGAFVRVGKWGKHIFYVKQGYCK
jgi:N-acetylmuramoyl-L-alanine amidase